MTEKTCTIVGRGRAGGSFAGALGEAGWTVRSLLGRADDKSNAGVGVDLVLLTVPDDVISQVAAEIDPTEACVAHVSGACDLAVLGAHRRCGSIHPLMSLPDAKIGAARLGDSCFFATDGDPLMDALVDDLGGMGRPVPAEKRVLYHATAAVAANHLVALCHHIETMAADVEMPLEAYWRLMITTLENVAEAGAQKSLTGPAARGDWQTVSAHLDQLQLADLASERALYVALSQRAAAIAGRTWPQSLG